MVATRRDLADGSVALDELGIMEQTASVLAKLGETADVAEALRLYEEVVASKTQQLGPDHILTLRTQHNLAGLLKHMGRLAEARTLYEVVVVGMMVQVGPAHQDTLSAKMSFASLLKTMGERVEARVLFAEVVTRQTEQLGPGNISTLKTKANLASLLLEIEEWAEAQILYEEVMVGFTEQLGPMHEDTLSVKMNLANLLNETGELTEAHRLHEEVVAGLTEQHGPGHIHTLTAKFNLAVVTDAITDAQKQIRRGNVDPLTVAGFTAQLGPAHPDTQLAVDNLEIQTAHQAKVMEENPIPVGNAITKQIRRGNFFDDLSLLDEVVAGFTENLGPDHPDTQMAVENLEIQIAHQAKVMEENPLPVGTPVAVAGLVAAAQHNGELGTLVGGPDPTTSRYTVRMDIDEEGGGAKYLGLKPANLRVRHQLVEQRVSLTLQHLAEHKRQHGDIVAVKLHLATRSLQEQNGTEAIGLLKDILSAQMSTLGADHLSTNEVKVQVGLALEGLIASAQLLEDFAITQLVFGELLAVLSAIFGPHDPVTQVVQKLYGGGDSKASTRRTTEYFLTRSTRLEQEQPVAGLRSQLRQFQQLQPPQAAAEPEAESPTGPGKDIVLVCGKNGSGELGVPGGSKIKVPTVVAHLGRASPGR
jgi:hypothetical protein